MSRAGKRRGPIGAIGALLRITAVAFAMVPPGESLQGIPEVAATLHEGAVIERTIDGKQVDSYRFELKGGQFFQAVIDQKGVDLTTVFLDSAGRRLHVADVRWAGVESASLLATVAGSYRLEIRTVHPVVVPRPYVIRIVAMRDSRAGDDSRVSAEAASTEIKSLIAANTPESKKKALMKCKEALVLWRSLEDGTAEAQTLNSTGYLQNEFGAQDEALSTLAGGLEMWRRLADRFGEGEALHNMAAASSARGQKRDALALYQEAASIRRSIEDIEGAAATLANIGAAHFYIGEPQQAIEALEESVQLWAQSGNRQGQIQSSINLGAAVAAMGENQRALDAFEKALPLAREIHDTRGEAYVLYNLGRVHDELGDRTSAAGYLEAGIQLMERAGDMRGLAAMLVTAGSVYFAQDQLPKALSSYERAVATTTDPFVQTPALLNTARVREAMGDHGAASQMSLEALRRAQEIEDRRTEAAAHRNRAEIRMAEGQPQQALEHLNIALALNQKSGFRLGEANVRLAVARANSMLGQLTRALEESETALKLIEAVRTRVASSNLRVSYFASRQDFFRFHIDLLMSLHAKNQSAGYDREALNTSERARARGLLDLLHEAGIDIHRGADPVLLAERRSIQRRLNLSASTLMRIAQGRQGEIQREETQKQIDALAAQLDGVEAKLRATSPAYGSLVQPQTLTVSDIQRLLRPGTALIEYAFGEQRSYAWLIKPDRVKSFQLAPELKIAAAAKRFREWSSRKIMQRTAAGELSSLLLYPLASELKHTRRLVIVPEPILQHVPFGALPLRNGSMLVASHEIAYLPSASVIPALDRIGAGRQPGRSQVVVFADPVFHRDDDRVRQVPANAPHESNSAFERTVRQLLLTDSGLRLPRLRFTREEAKAISELAPGHVAARLDFDASRSAATGPLARDATILHFATHTFVNNLRPELSGIVLSLVDKRGRPQDGFLRLHDIYNLETRAGLVVLSSCESGLGKEITGEGLVGFTRAFHYAGASRVLVTLWKVNDESTAEFMRHFYHALLARKMRPAAALRAAQMAMANAKDPRLHSPYSWGGFVLHGDWR